MPGTVLATGVVVRPVWTADVTEHRRHLVPAATCKHTPAPYVRHRSGYTAATRLRRDCDRRATSLRLLRGRHSTHGSCTIARGS